VGAGVICARHYGKVLGPVIRWDVVYVMHYLVASQKPPQHPFGYKPVLKDITPGICARMVRGIDKPAPILAVLDAAAPFRVFVSALIPRPRACLRAIAAGAITHWGK